MNDNELKILVKSLADPIAKKNNCEVLNVDYLKEDGCWFLKVFIKRINGEVLIGDCEKVSRELSKALDKADPIESGYILEVSSPGIEYTE